MIARSIPLSPPVGRVCYTRDLKHTEGGVMKRQALVISATLSLLVMLMATSVNAQSFSRIKVNIPFEFSVREKVFPAGEYTLRYRGQTFLLIESADRGASQVFGTYP